MNRTTFDIGNARVSGIANPFRPVEPGMHPRGCGCGLAHDGTGNVDPRLVSIDASVDPRAGETADNGKEIWTPEDIAFYLNRAGYSWVPGGRNTPQRGDTDANTITFGFFNTQDDLIGQGYTFEYFGQPYGSAEFFNFASFNAEQRAATREAMRYWDDVVGVRFLETSSANADIALGNLANAPDTQAYAYYPQTVLYGIPSVDAQVRNLGGDVWVSASQASNFQLKVGGYGLNTLTHEVGHALGLAHPGNYNFGPGFAVNYENGAEYFQDSRNYTIMSYWNPSAIGAGDVDFNTMARAYGGTPMVHDILAAQRIYGADMSTRTGNTTYGFNSNAGRDAFDFTINKAPLIAIWDAGGVDTLDASGYATNQRIDLTPGSLSTIGGVTIAQAQAMTLAQVNANRADLGYGAFTQAQFDSFKANALADPDYYLYLSDNVGIAYGTIIENAVGGSGNDVLVANSVANMLDGRGGFDIVSYESATMGVTVNLQTRQTAGGAGGDRLLSIEGVYGSAFDDTITGDNNDNVISGGSGGRDRLFGNGGIDTLTYFDSLTGVTVNIGTNQTAGGALGDIISGFENLTGSDFGDVLTGSFSNNTILGGGGSDRLDGGFGDDILDGGAGSDILTGGAGRDTFTFSDADGSYDRITDFQSVVDKIDLRGIDANEGTAGDQAFAFVGSAAFNGTAGQLRYANGLLQGDIDGDRVADFTIEVNRPLTINDLIL
ncbi:M10 family metallopeptidase C-terminal domain-containing protein [Sphingomonas baiyangensis]|uniref:Matrixin family metalloprotease n=1 Tax=Sphingomonas baiyangensis TaxID=2572576 RepID=A0A4U1L3B1_9SPHN|nr:M10 family metallopeptidase C-terminal domain-containing protein [Sphingomonas baiyangensis]TKD50720.1 matrixin family metalloprotease [Sphingomonas baiyangensis]